MTIHAVELYIAWRNGDELEILRGQNKNKAFVVFNKRTEQISNLIINCMKPIETPDEKAQRLREEWVEHALKLTNKEISDSYDAVVIYSALLSGDLPVPGKGE